MEDADIRAEAARQEWVQEELEEKCKRLKDALRRIDVMMQQAQLGHETSADVWRRRLAYWRGAIAEALEVE